MKCDFNMKPIRSLTGSTVELSTFDDNSLETLEATVMSDSRQFGESKFILQHHRPAAQPSYDAQTAEFTIFPCMLSLNKEPKSCMSSELMMSKKKKVPMQVILLQCVLDTYKLLLDLLIGILKLLLILQYPSLLPFYNVLQILHCFNGSCTVSTCINYLLSSRMFQHHPQILFR